MMNRSRNAAPRFSLAAAILSLAVGCGGAPGQDSAASLSASRSGQTQGQANPDSNGAPESGNVLDRIPPPEGFQRLAADPDSFGAWLRQLQLRPGRSTVYLHDGRPKGNQSLHHAVLDIDVGAKDLQQCADAVIRLRAEYLFSTPCSDEIHFNFTSGDEAGWLQWKQGERPSVSGNRVSWDRRADQDGSYQSFRRYLETVFTYAGSASLQEEMEAVDDPLRLQSGDVFIQGGFPGHAVLVMDVARDESGGRAFLLAQSYMPAQDIHVLKSFSEFDPWYLAKSDGPLRTPEWTFDYRDLKRFRRSRCEEQ